MPSRERYAPISGVSAVSREKPRNLAASVRQRLFNRAQDRHEDFGLVLTKYGLERFLYRLAQSRYQDQFVLKGALLFELWTHRPYRPTRDLDLEGYGENSIVRIKRLFAEIIRQEVEDDGLVFDPESLHVARISEDQEYEGLRVNFVGRLERAKIHMQVDVGFGDVIVPPPQETVYPAMLEFPSAQLLAYSRETVVAEKLEALVKLGIANTRMKDFYDLWILSRDFDFDGVLSSDAIKATFKRRRTEIPSDTPVALTDEFSSDPQKAKQWQAFVKKSNLDSDQATLDEVAIDLTQFVMPPLQAILRSQHFPLTWLKGGPWSPPNMRT
jgi:predicted nucleotidyltransferase component of viral defense system